MADIVAFGAHPDDLEFGCGGILAKSAAQGLSVVMVDLTHGEKATNGLPEIRRKESEKSAQVIGAKRVFLDFADCEIIDSYEGRLALVRVIREHKPKLVLAPLWKGEQTHPDHIACGLMARYACRYSRFSKILPELPTHKPEGILHYISSVNESADFLIDVSDHMEAWKKMMDAHQSQHQTFPYSDWVLRNASRMGIFIDRPYAQGLSMGNPVIIDNVMSIARGSREI